MCHIKIVCSNWTLLQKSVSCTFIIWSYLVHKATTFVRFGKGHGGNLTALPPVYWKGWFSDLNLWPVTLGGRCLPSPLYFHHLTTLKFFLWRRAVFVLEFSFTPIFGCSFFKRWFLNFFECWNSNILIPGWKK